MGSSETLHLPEITSYYTPLQRDPRPRPGGSAEHLHTGAACAQQAKQRSLRAKQMW